MHRSTVCLSENYRGEGDSPILLRGLRKIGTVPGRFRIGSKPIALATLLFCLSPAAWADSHPNQLMIEGKVRGTPVEGLPLRITPSQIDLLSRDGYLWEFRRDEATGMHKTSLPFHSYSFPELRSALEREVGGRLQLTATSHYLVAHPRGDNKWPDRFEELYRSFVHYFTVRRIGAEESRVPADRPGLAQPARLRALRPKPGAAGRPRSVGLLFAGDQSDHAVRFQPGRARRLRFGLAARRGHDHPRGGPSNRLQHRRAQPLRAAAAVAGRRLGHVVRSPGDLRFAALARAGRSDQPGPAGAVPPVRGRRAAARRPFWASSNRISCSR